MARKSHGIGECRKDSRRRSIVMSPRPRTRTGVLRVRLLRVEERLRSRQLRTHLLDEFRHRSDTGDRIPVPANKGVALHGLGIDRRIVLVKTTLPPPRPVHRDVARIPFGRPRTQTTPESSCIVIAVEKEFCDAPSV